MTATCEVLRIRLHVRHLHGLRSSRGPSPRICAEPAAPDRLGVVTLCMIGAMGGASHRTEQHCTALMTLSFTGRTSLLLTTLAA